MLNFFYGLATGIGLTFAFVCFLFWLFKEGAEHTESKNCSHDGKRGALRWAYWNMPYAKKGEEVEKMCGQCGKMQFYIKK